MLVFDLYYADTNNSELDSPSVIRNMIRDYFD